MAQKSEAESQEWVVTGMDCASCAVKIRTAVERLPGVSDVTVAVMAEKLTLKLEPGTTPRDKIEAAVTKLGFGIGAAKAKKAKAFVMPGALDAGKDDGHAGPDHADHVGHDHVASSDTMANVTPAPVDSEDGHGAPGHIHNDPADRGKRWYETGKGRLVIGTGLLLCAAWAVKYACVRRHRKLGVHRGLPDRCGTGGAAGVFGAASRNAFHH